MPRRRELDPALEDLGLRLLSHAREVLGRNLRARRLALGKTQEQLAEDVGVSTIYVQALERGRDENPTLRVLAVLAEALDLSLPRLLATAEEGTTILPRNAPGIPRRSPKRVSRVRKTKR